MANVALPAIMQEFGIGLDSGLWAVTLYTLLFAVLMPACGYLGDLYGHRRVYLGGIALFSLASLGSGLAPSFPWLLGARVLQGIGVAPTLPAIMAIITRVFRPQERGRAMGFWALANGVGHSLGPPLSGFLTQHLGWRAVFFFLLPLCAANLYLLWRLVPAHRDQTTRGFDLPGATTLTAAAVAGMLALSRSARWGWAAPGSLALWGVCITSLVLFTIVEKRTTSPFVDLTLLSHRHYLAATMVIALQLFCLFGLLLVSPILLIQAYGYSSQAAGLLTLPLPLAMATMAPAAGYLADIQGSRRTASLGAGLMLLAGLILLGLHPASGRPIPHWGWVGGLALAGAGMGLIQSPTTVAVTHVVAEKQLGVATGIFHMARFISGSLGSMAFGLILHGSPAGIAAGFQSTLVLVLAVAASAIGVARGLPRAAIRAVKRTG